MSNLLPVLNKLKSGEQDKGAYLSDKESFLKIYRLEKSRRERDWPSSFILQIRLAEQDEQREEPDQAGKLMLDILKTRIRGGDVICRWDKSHFIILLYNIEKSGVETVFDRLRFFFYSEHDNPDEVKVDHKYYRVG